MQLPVSAAGSIGISSPRIAAHKPAVNHAPSSQQAVKPAVNHAPSSQQAVKPAVNHVPSSQQAVKPAVNRTPSSQQAVKPATDKNGWTHVKSKSSMRRERSKLRDAAQSGDHSSQLSQPSTKAAYHTQHSQQNTRRGSSYLSHYNTGSQPGSRLSHNRR